MALELIDPAGLNPDAIEEGTAFAPRFDANGLLTAIAVDAQSNEVLMVGFMNRQALGLTIETGFVHYFSRSRQKIWKKGETSGELQKLVEMRVDCDQDALMVLVDAQGHGAACHTGHKSCFYRSVNASDGKVRLETIGGAPLFDPKQVYAGS